MGLGLEMPGRAGREAREIGESIAQRSRRPQRGIRGLSLGTCFGDAGACRARTREMGKASHRGHGGHGGGLRGKSLGLVDARAAGREAREMGKASHRGHGGHRGGIRGKSLGLVDAGAAGREAREMGKHRTEVTEATGGNKREIAGVGGRRGCRARSTRNGKASHRGHGGHRGGIRGKSLGLVDARAAGREAREMGKAIARGERIGVWAFCGQPGMFFEGKKPGAERRLRRHANTPIRRHVSSRADTLLRSPDHFSRKTLMAVKKSIARWRITSLTCCRLDLPLA